MDSGGEAAVVGQRAEGRGQKKNSATLALRHGLSALCPLPFKPPGCEAFSAAAFSIISASIAPVTPLFAGRLAVQISGVSAARMSSKSASLFFTLLENSAVTSIGPDQSSRCLMSNQLRPDRSRDPRV
jgi:hypothetical protein